MASTEQVTRLLDVVARSTGIEETTAKLNAMSTAHEGVAVASQKSEKATQSMQSRLNSIQRQYDAVYRAEQALARVERDLANAQGQGLITNQRRLELLSLAAEKHGLATAAINREISATERLANVQRAQAAANQNLRGVGPVNTANIAAQFQDIGVTAAMGMNPLQIALQQGTQLSAVLGPMGAAGAVRSLGAAFVSLVNPVSLITLGLVGLTAAAIQYFMSTEDGADKADVALKEHEAAIGAVAKRWGDALPALKAYSDELDRQREIADRAAGVATGINTRWDQARQILPDVKTAIGGVVEELIRAGAGRSQIDSLRDGFNEVDRASQDLQNALLAGANGLAEYGTLSKELAELQANKSVTATAALAGVVGQLADAYSRAADEAKRMADQAAFVAGMERSQLGPLDPLNGFRRTPFQTEEEIMYQRGERARLAEEGRLGGIGIPTPTPRPNDIERLDATPNAQDYLRTQRDSLEMLRTEIGLVGQSEAVRSRQIAVLQVEQEIRRRGIDLYGVEAQEMRANAAMQVELSQRLAAMKKQEIEGAQASKKIYEDVYGFANDQLQKLIDGTFTWRDALKSLIPVLLNILNTLATGNGGTSIGGFLNNLSDLFAGRGIGATNAGTAFRETGGGLLGMLGGGSGLVAANSNVASTVSQAALGGGSLSFGGNFRNGVDQRLMDILQTAAERSAQSVMAISGLRVGDPRFHGKGLAADISLLDPSGKALANYQNASTFRAYEQFAQIAKQVQMEKFPDLADKFRWGGYFSGGKGKYGAMDLMHFDLAGAGMGGGSWQRGLTEAQRSLWPGAESVGMAATKAQNAITSMASSAQMATKGLGSFAGGIGGLAQQLSSIAGGSGGGWAGGLMNLFGGAGGALSHMMSISPLATKFILGGGVGLFANGTENAPEGWAWVGEEGPELRKLRAGDVIRSNPRSMQMSGSGRMPGPTGVKVDVGVSVDGEGSIRAYVKNVVSTDAKQIARGEAAGILSNYDYAQRQGGAAGTDQRYGALKAGRRN